MSFTFKLFEAAKGALPRWLFQDRIESEYLQGAAKLLGQAWTQVDYWWSQTFIKSAEGFWLDQHAIDRGTRRQLNETDVVLRARLRSVEELVTLAGVKAGADAILVAAGQTPSSILVQLRKTRAFFNHAYFDTGYRMAYRPPANYLIIILPYGTTVETQRSVAEAVRTKKAGGVIEIIERRLTPP